jgi:P-type Ca2+ transporter type 2B
MINNLHFLQGLLTNPIYCAIWVCTLIVQFLIVEFGGRWFSTAPLTLEQWLWCVAFGVGSLLWAQVTILLMILLMKFQMH